MAWHHRRRDTKRGGRRPWWSDVPRSAEAADPAAGDPGWVERLSDDEVEALLAKETDDGEVRP